MGVDVFSPYDQDNIDQLGTNDPAKEFLPDSIWSGTGTAIARGAAGGGAALARVGYDAYTKKTNNPLGISDSNYNNIDEQIQKVQDWAKLDPRTTGQAASVVGGLARAGTIMAVGSLFGGPRGGAITLGLTEGYNEYRDLRREGVDGDTAKKVGAVTGVLDATGALLPMAVGTGLATKMAFGATVNTAFGATSRALTSSVLESGGYTDMASQYKAIDKQAMIADAILGAVFGGVGHLEGGKPDLPTRDLIDEALDLRKEEQTGRGASGIPTDLNTANLDQDLQRRSLFEVLQGKNPEISSDEAHVIMEGSLIDPEKTKLYNDFVNAGEAVHGDLADHTDPIKTEKESVPYPEENSFTTPSSDSESTAKLSPIAEESLRQLSMRHPDLEVDMPDGTTIKAEELQGKIKEELAKTDYFAKLHDVAISCFLRTK